MTDMGLMSYYLGLEVKQMKDGIFMSQEGYAKEVLKKFKMLDSKPVKTPMVCGVKLRKFDDGKKVDSTFFKSLVGSLRYLTCTRPGILFSVGLVSRFMEAPSSIHMKVAKRILRYLKGNSDIPSITPMDTVEPSAPTPPEGTPKGVDMPYIPAFPKELLPSGSSIRNSFPSNPKPLLVIVALLFKSEIMSKE
ncbi:hypothetical protein RJ639_021845 [Escallonia herrerae]|uniref:Reverse transcriptase Ty1/copia-type domain-containing protein n=1 Tax=Escallonia herrerae TaxID=1293975 RepID=A0AA88V8Z6_9ASTE|nr:hypothetical protein RJ639_021845 [Escallonia herrerae]